MSTPSITERAYQIHTDAMTAWRESKTEPKPAAPSWAAALEQAGKEAAPQPNETQQPK